MSYLLIEHRIGDFNKWKSVYDRHEGERRKAGLRELFLLKDKDHPDMVTILFEARDIDKAEEFIGSKDLKDKMREGGVKGTPSIHLLEKAEGARLRRAA